jgi:hypothetical protein
MTERELFVRCSCYSEGVQLVDDAEDKMIYLSLWDSHVHPPGPRQPWRQRLRHIWRIIRTGTPFDDDVILSYDDARKIRDFLSAITEEE